jgi:Fe-Mn family superoxide dismutase
METHIQSPQACMTPAMALALEASFGSVSRWREAFLAMGRALSGGSGEVLLVFQPEDGRLLNQQTGDHAHAVAGGIPLLAFHLDADAAVRTSVDTFMDKVDWTAVYARYQQAVHDASEPFGAAQDEIGQAIVLDVRRKGVFDQAQTRLVGAAWRDPAEVDQWAASLPAGRDVVVYCVYGHEVGRSTALRLRAAGVAARYLRGGIDAWQSSGRSVESKGAHREP